MPQSIATSKNDALRRLFKSLVTSCGETAKHATLRGGDIQLTRTLSVCEQERKENFPHRRDGSGKERAKKRRASPRQK